MPLQPPSYLKWIYFSAALFVFVYLVLRALHVPILEDEAATYFRYVEKGEFYPAHKGLHSNNHILNTFLSILFFNIFGQHIVVLRLPNLLFFLVFALYTWKLAARFIEQNLVRAGFLFSMLCAHNLVEYFGYARGYGISMALLTGAVYYLAEFSGSGKTMFLRWFYIYTGLAVFANLTLLNTALLLNAWMFFMLFRHKKPVWLTATGMLSGFVPVFFGAWISFRMKQTGSLNYGGGNNFWEVTVKSLVGLVYGEWNPYIAAGFITLCLCAIIAWVYTGFVKNENKKAWLISPATLAGFLFIGNIIGCFLLKLLFQVNYPKDRVAMYFYFLLVMFFFFTLDTLSWKGKKYLALLGLLVPVHFITRANITHSTFWISDRMPATFYNRVLNEIPRDPSKISIGGTGKPGLTWAWYNQLNQGKLNLVQEHDYPSFYYDYLLLEEKHILPETMDIYENVMTDPFSNIHLLKRKTPVEYISLGVFSLPDITGSREAFINFYDQDTLAGFYQNLCFTLKTDLSTESRYIDADLVVTSRVNGQEDRYQNLSFSLLKNSWKGKQRFEHSLYLSNISHRSNQLIFYFFNVNKVPVSFQNTTLEISYQK